MGQRSRTGYRGPTTVVSRIATTTRSGFASRTAIHKRFAGRCGQDSVTFGFHRLHQGQSAQNKRPTHCHTVFDTTVPLAGSNRNGVSETSGTGLSLNWFQSKQEENGHMALARCLTCGRPQGLKHNYTYPHEQISLPANHVVFCGAKGCTRLAMIWLTDDEEEQYVQGVRSFREHTTLGRYG